MAKFNAALKAKIEVPKDTVFPKKVKAKAGAKKAVPFKLNAESLKIETAVDKLLIATKIMAKGKKGGNDNARLSSNGQYIRVVADVAPGVTMPKVQLEGLVSKYKKAGWETATFEQRDFGIVVKLSPLPTPDLLNG